MAEENAPDREVDDAPVLDCAGGPGHRHDSLCYGIDNWRGEL